MKKYIKIEHLVIDDFWVYKATDKDGYVALNYMFGTSDEDYEIFKKEYCKADEWFTTWYNYYYKGEHTDEAICSMIHIWHDAKMTDTELKCDEGSFHNVKHPRTYVLDSDIEILIEHLYEHLENHDGKETLRDILIKLENK